MLRKTKWSANSGLYVSQSQNLGHMLFLNQYTVRMLAGDCTKHNSTQQNVISANTHLLISINALTKSRKLILLRFYQYIRSLYHFKAFNYCRIFQLIYSHVAIEYYPYRRYTYTNIKLWLDRQLHIPNECHQVKNGGAKYLVLNSLDWYPSRQIRIAACEMLLTAE